MSRSGRETLWNVPEWWEALLDVRQLSGGPSEVREALPDVRELSRVPTGNLGGQPGGVRMVGTPSRMSLRGGRPFRMSGSCRVALPDVRECSGGPPG